MAVFVVVDGKRVEIPAEVRAGGVPAIAAWEKELRRPAKRGAAAGGDK